MTTALAASSTIITSTEDLPGAAPFIEGEVKAYPLAEKRGITLIAIAFDAGTTLPNHTAPAPITLHALSGQVQVTVDGREHPLPAGGIMHIDSRVPHELTAPVRSRVLLTLVGEATEKPVVPAILRKA